MKKNEDGKVELPLADAESDRTSRNRSSRSRFPHPSPIRRPVQVTVPVAKDEGDELNYGIVVFAIDAEGNETVIPKCAVDDDGNVVFEATGDFTIKVVDNARTCRTSRRPTGSQATWSTSRPRHRQQRRHARRYQAVQGGADVTREQVAVFLMRYADHLGMDVSARSEIDFPDAGEVSDFARDAMSWAVVEGLFSGDDVTGELNPTDGAARAEVATVLMRFINLMYA